MIDFVCLSIYVAILGSLKTRDSLVLSLCFLTSVVYTLTPLWELHPASVNHLMISLCFFPSIFFTSKWVSLSAILYATYHWIVAGDYIFFAQETFISETFYYFSPAINAIMMGALIYGGIRNHTPIHSVDTGWLSNMVYRALHNKENKAAK